ncbi:hypothetical protein [Bradyrhizobium paxllaeri]|uniref:hypothetical protein n=1 Tax=Bradyrhizobium paxllaeri TaxID=190148 RepID=UPI0009FCA309|nr:hypothetical protein [Bradyrhizobium paxllaeri]
MTKEGRKGVGPTARSKGAGTGAMTDFPEEKLGENDVLSNRDKASRSETRGQDGKRIQSDQYQSTVHEKR